MKSITQFFLTMLLSILFTAATIAQPFTPFYYAYFLNNANQWAGKSQFEGGVTELSLGADFETGVLNSRLVAATNFTDFDNGRLAIYGQGVDNNGIAVWARDYFPAFETPDQFNVVTSDILLGFANNDVWRVLGDIEFGGTIQAFDMATTPLNGAVITARRGAIRDLGDVLVVTTPDDFANNLRFDNILGSVVDPPIGGSSMFFGGFKYNEVGVPEDILRIAPNVNNEYMISGISDVADNRFYTIIVDEPTGVITANGTYKEYFIPGLPPIQRVLTETDQLRTAVDNYTNVLFTPQTDQIHVVLMDLNRTITLVRSFTLNNLFPNVGLEFNSIESVTRDINNPAELIITGDALVDLPGALIIPFEIRLNKANLMPILSQLVPLYTPGITFSTRVPRLDRRELTTGWRRGPGFPIDPRCEMRVLESFDTGGLLDLMANGGPCLRVPFTMDDETPPYIEDEQVREYEEIIWDWTEIEMDGEEYAPEQVTCIDFEARVTEDGEVVLNEEDFLAMVGANGVAPPELFGKDNTVRLTVYPNPTTGDEFNLNLEGLGKAGQKVSIELYDLLGRNVFMEQFTNTDDSVQKTINLNKEINNGIYLVQIKVGDRYLAMQKLVVERN